MKTQKLIGIVAIICLLVGASGVAMVEAANCEFGFIANATVQDIHADLAGNNCLISGALVIGPVIIRNGTDVVIRNSRVFGNVRILDTENVVIVDSEVVDGDVKVIRPTTAYIVDNSLLRSGIEQHSLVVRGVGRNTEDREGEALIFDNKVEDGYIRCRNNNEQAFARSNIAVSVECPGQIFDD